jgi:hypothetical protein
MLALLLGIVLGYKLCDEVDSCKLQVNGTLPRNSIISTLPNGGHGHAWTTTDCIRGLIGITETCQCQNSTMFFNPGFCYFSGNYSQHSARTSTHFCKNQNGQNTFSTLNHSAYLGCYCFDPTRGQQQMATFIQPVCKKGSAKYIPCSTDGKNDNEALLKAYTGADQAVLNLLSISKSQQFGRCQCGSSDCSATEGRPYCQSNLGNGYCSAAPACEVGKVFEPTDLFQKECQCGYFTCGHKEKCESQDTDGVERYVCTYNDASSSNSFLLKQFFGAMGLAFTFSLIAFLCIILVILFWILTCLKVNRAAELAKTNIQAQ